MASKVLVTGGAGFIGSHLVDLLVGRGLMVVVLDNLTGGSRANLQLSSTKPNFTFVEGDLKDSSETVEALDNVDVVYHFAANPEVRDVDPRRHFYENQFATFTLLEAMRKSSTERIVFTSTSTVYGEASTQPTPEDYGPLIPISTYGASKLACEALISSYAYTYGMGGLILRLGNVIGQRSNHGVIVDFLRKLRGNPEALEVLGDGSQAKSYVHILDCLSGIMLAAEKFLDSRSRVEVYNIGSVDKITVGRIAEIVLEEVNSKARIRLSGGVDGGRGWMGDVKTMQLSIAKLQALGWNPLHTSEQAVRQATRELANQV
jgi:UDP-glucose 4-epimerase